MKCQLTKLSCFPSSHLPSLGNLNKCCPLLLLYLFILLFTHVLVTALYLSLSLVASLKLLELPLT